MKQTYPYVFYPERLAAFSWLRLAYFAMALAALFATEWSARVYRPYINANAINDFGIADASGNLFGIAALVFFALFICHANWKQSLFWIGTQPIGMMLYECIQPLLPWGTFDAHDIAATAIGAGFVFLINLGLHAVLNRRFE